jgi:hypothetical protein
MNTKKNKKIGLTAFETEVGFSTTDFLAFFTGSSAKR